MNMQQNGSYKVLKRIPQYVTYICIELVQKFQNIVFIDIVIDQAVYCIAMQQKVQY